MNRAEASRARRLIRSVVGFEVGDGTATAGSGRAAELGEAPAGSDHYRVLFLTGVLLFSITFVVNLTADLVIRGIRKK